MSVTISRPKQSGVVYPESDGQPIAENTLQYRWISTIKEGVESIFGDRSDVFVAADLFWYPVEGEPQIRVAPDVMIVFGRPKGDRGSYMQWKEGGIAPQVTFEILSPGNRNWEMEQKLLFYEDRGVLEYYLYDPQRIELSGWTRAGDELQPIAGIDGWTSPRLRIKFDLGGTELTIYGPDGRRFLNYQELRQQRDQLADDRDRMVRDRRIAVDRDRIAVERDEAVERLNRLSTRLRELGLDPDS